MVAERTWWLEAQLAVKSQEMLRAKIRVVSLR